MNEFEIIEKILIPLTRGAKEALSLKDDAAIITPKPEYDLVITKDAIIENVHFLPNTEPGLIAKKLLRVNLSDMAAMGAKPRFALIAAMLNDSCDIKWLTSFSNGLKEDLDKYDLSVIGGDTTKHKGAISFSMTLIGEVPSGRAIKRSGAKAGDTIFVTGTIGNSALGLRALKGELRNWGTKELVSRYNLPEPRVEIGLKLKANAAIDISDGLIADLNHICECSEVGAVIYTDKIPLSDSARKLLNQDSSLLEVILTGGDDYELLFTSKEETLPYATPIGKIKKEGGIDIFDKKGEKITLSRYGYTHL